MIKLLSYQVEDALWLATMNYAGLFSEMGIGKTPIAIEAARMVRAENILVVCPAVGKYNWQAEFIKFDNRVSFVAGEGKTYHTKKTVIISFNYLVMHLHLYTSRQWDVVIIDEAHLLKEPTAQRTGAAFGTKGIIHFTKKLWALTGTPAPNHVGELWVMLYTFGYIKISYNGFVNRYCNSRITGDSRYSRVEIQGTNTKRSPEIKKLLKKMSLRRLKKDVLDLPPIFHNTYYIKGDDDAAIFKQFPDLKEKVREESKRLQERLGIDIEISDEKLLNSLQFMSQSISSLRRYHGLKKIKDTAELIDFELESKHYSKLIVFGWHTDVLLTLQRSLKKYKSVMIRGGMTDKAKKFAYESFQNDPTTTIFYGNIQAAGTSITLTAASQVIFIEDDFVPGNNRQAADRAHRYGQKHTVNVRHIAIKDSLDAKITATLVRKIKEIKTFID